MRRLTPFIAFSYLCGNPAWGGESQSHAAILDTARSYLENQIAPTAGDYRIDLSPIEGRLQLAVCDAPLEAFNLSDKRVSGQITVGVRCTGSTPWTVYTRAKVSILQTVLVLRESVPKDGVVTSAHLDYAQKDISDLRGGYFTAPEQAIGRRAVRTLAAGTVLAGNVLETPKIIKRGQKVSIRLRNVMLDVHMDGTALTDAEEGQRVRVRNESSGRIIEGTAAAPGLVEVE